MIISLQKLTVAMQKVRSFASDQKNVPGVMLDIQDDKIKVCYSDGKKSLIKIIDAQLNETDLKGRFIVPYQSFMDVIDTCQPSGVIETGDLEITLDEKSMVIETVKFVAIDNGELDADGNAKYDRKVVSKFKQTITAARPEDDIRYGVLSRMDYDAIFAGEEFDIWSRDVLRDTLNRVSKEDNKIAYFSRKVKAAYVANLAFVTYIPTSEIEDFGFTIASKLARYMVDILGKVDTDKIRVSVAEDRYCKVVSDDDTFGAWFELAPASKTDPITLKRYEDKQYTSYNLVFNRFALINVISCALATDKNEKTALTFKETNEGLSMRISNSGTSSNNDFAVIAESYVDNLGNIKEVQIPVSLKVMYDILNNCTETYVMIDIASDEGGKFIRATDTEGKDGDGNPIVKTIHYTIASK